MVFAHCKQQLARMRKGDALPAVGKADAAAWGSGVAFPDGAPVCCLRSSLLCLPSHMGAPSTIPFHSPHEVGQAGSVRVGLWDSEAAKT